MNNIGFIGFGSMGSMLIRGFIKSGQVRQDQIIVTRKDKSRLNEIKSVLPKANIAQDVTEVINHAKYIFICVKPLEYMNILDEAKACVLPDQQIISITGSVMIDDMDKMVDCKISKVIPTIVSEVNEGITLICHNRKVSDEDAACVESLLGSIGKIQRIDEKDFGFASELTSCGPGLIAAIFQQFAAAGLRHTNSFNKDDISKMLLQTLYGTARLMLEEKMDFDDVISRVATKGGITEEGVKVIAKNLPQVFDEMFEMTMNKREVVSEGVISIDKKQSKR